MSADPSTREDLEAAFGGAYRHIDRTNWNTTSVVGDVYGYLDALERLLAQLSVTDRDLVVFVGDLVRKGPETSGVLELVRNAPNMLSVRGDNEQKLLDGAASLPDFAETECRVMALLPVGLGWEGGLVVHGVVDPRKPLRSHGRDDVANAFARRPNVRERVNPLPSSPR